METGDRAPGPAATDGRLWVMYVMVCVCVYIYIIVDHFKFCSIIYSIRHLQLTNIEEQNYFL